MSAPSVVLQVRRCIVGYVAPLRNYWNSAGVGEMTSFQVICTSSLGHRSMKIVSTQERLKSTCQLALVIMVQILPIAASFHSSLDLSVNQTVSLSSPPRGLTVSVNSLDDF